MTKRLRGYVIGWLIYLLIVVVTMMSAQAYALNCLLAYTITTWIAMLGIYVFEGRMINRYLRERHPAKWSEITRLPGFSAGGYNSISALSFLYSRDDLGDPELGVLKSSTRKLVFLLVAVFFHYVVLWPLALFLLAESGSHR
jgi:hypothetical protein